MRIIKKCKRDRSKDWFHKQWNTVKFFIVNELLTLDEFKTRFPTC